MITPAISVISAVEGLNVVTPSLAHLVVPISLGILIVLFAVQRFGTGAVGWLFGPVILLWFVGHRAARAHGGRRPPGRAPGPLADLGRRFMVDHGWPAS